VALLENDHEVAALAAHAPALPRTVEEIRGEFPLLERRINGRPVAYLDNAATSQKPESVIEAIDHYYRHSNANIHRSIHQLAAEATALYEGGRAKVAALVGGRPEETIFVRNATEAINLVRFTWARANLTAGDTVLVTRMEHHSNLVPWQLACEESGARLDYLEVDDEGKLDLSELDAKLATGDVRLVAVTHMSNVLGTINPLAEITRRAHRAGAAVLGDGAQAVPQMPVDVGELGVDFYAFTGHKMLAPTGIGVLWARSDLLEEMPPFMGGGSMISKVEDHHSTWAPLPAKFEAGTPAIAEAAGLGAAVDYLNGLGMDAVRAHERDLTAYALERLAAVPGLTVYGPSDAADRGALASFSMEGIHPHDIAEMCNRDAVCIRAGHHCAQPLMRSLGVHATARASFAVYNTRDEVDRLIGALEAARALFGT
jgi:cysteine desulfurase/selenocysteine lyase